jgi:hypothetical protein
MLCQKCKYEPTMAEIQRSQGACIKCSADYSSYQPSSSAPKAAKLAGLVFFVGVFLAAAVLGWQWNENRQKKELLFSQVSQQVRVINGLVGELLDQGAGMTRGQFFEKASRRVIDIDAAIAHTLSIDDSVMPGLSQQAAAYGKASRSLIKAIGEQQRAEIALSVAKAGHSVYAKHETDPNFRLLLSRSPTQIEAEGKAALAAVENEAELSKKVELLKKAADIGNSHGLRINYLKSKDEVDRAKSIFDAANRNLAKAVERIGAEGRRLNDSSGHKFPIEKWAIN